MRVACHVGPHKTGTTSIQNWLRRRYTSERPQPIWYPEVDDRSGPGHTLLAWKTIGMRGYSPSPEPLASLLLQAEEGGCQLLLLSSEDFSYMYPNQLSCFVEAFGSRPVDLVFTLSPYGKRTFSLWQERVKHGEIRAYEDTLDTILRHSSYTPGFVPDLATRFRNGTHHLVVTTPLDPPRQLLETFARCVGIEPPDSVVSGDELSSNRSILWIEAEILRSFNQAWERANQESSSAVDEAPPMVPRAEGQQALMGSLMGSEKWKARAPRWRPGIPAAWRSILSDRVCDCMKRLREAENRKQIQIAGNLGGLDDL